MLSAIRNFFLTLLASLILLGLVGYLITDFALGAMNPAEQAESEAQTDPPFHIEDPDVSQNGTQTADEGFTILLICHNYQPDVYDDYQSSNKVDQDGFPLPPRRASADSLLVVRVDQKTQMTFFCSIPTNARIEDGGIEKTLGSLYSDHGAAYLSEKVSTLIGIPVDHYISVGFDDAISLIDQIGGIEYTVPRDMEHYDAESGYRISLKSGKQKLNGAKVLQLLRYDGYGDDGNTRRDTAVKVLKTIITKIVSDPVYYDNAIDIFRDLSVYMETSLTEEIIARKLDLVFSYPRMKSSSVQYPGEFTAVDGVEWFIPSLNEGYALFNVYKHKG